MKRAASIGNYYFELHKSLSGECVVQIWQNTQILDGHPESIGYSDQFEDEDALGEFLADLFIGKIDKSLLQEPIKIDLPERS